MSGVIVEDDTTDVILVHTNIPDSEYKGIEDAWKSYYMIPLKEYLERKYE